MYLMLRLFIFLIVYSPFSTSAMDSHVVENQPFSSQNFEYNLSIEQTENFRKSYVIIPYMDFKKNDLFDFLLSLKNNDYSQDAYDDLDEVSKGLLERDMGLVQKLERLNELFDQKPLLFSKLKMFQNFCRILSELSDGPIYNILENYKEESLKRLNDSFSTISKLALTENDKFFIVVFPEAFFNYFQNRDGFGNFIPFFKKNCEELITAYSKNIKNVIWFTNIIHAGVEQEASTFNQNYEDYINNNNDQREIISNYTDYRDTFLRVVPIFNETFIFHGEAKLGSYKKRFILDGDIPFMKDSKGHRYLSKDRMIYVPGTNDQKFITNLFSVEICQDHTRIQKKEKSDFLIIQSASNNLDQELQHHYQGVCIHSDVDNSISSVYNCSNGIISQFKESLIKEGDLYLKIYNLDPSNPKLFNFDAQYR